MRYPSPDGSVKKGSPAPSQLVINTKHLLHGEDLEDYGKASILIENGRIAEIEEYWSSNPDIVVDVVMPLPVNTHVHLSDARIPEKCVGLSLSEYVGRKGVKHPYIRLIREPLIPGEVLETMILYGATGDYQELYMDCGEYKRILGGIGVEYIGLSRPKDWDHTSLEELESIACSCGGIGVSNPSVLPPWTLSILRELSRKYIVSAHVSETWWMEETGGLHYLLSTGVKLKHVVHGVYLEKWELKQLAENNIVLVVNPRSNLWFTGRIADVEYYTSIGGRIALGSDNAGCFHPDIRVDAELLYTLKPSMDPKLLVEALTINGYYALGLEPSVIARGKPALFIGFNIGLSADRSPNIYASIIKRSPYTSFTIVFKRDKYYVIRNGSIETHRLGGGDDDQA